MTRIITLGLFLFLIDEILSSRVIRRTGDLPQPDHCIFYNGGGKLGVHYYICCNNCVGTTQPSCPSIYHSASSGQYCGECGVDEAAGNGKELDEFSCGGCEGQLDADENCRSWWKEIPGFCWVYAGCFQEQCETYQNGETKRDLSKATCGNGVCDSGETSGNCAMDCCYKDNPEKCDMDNICENECCGEPSCCGVNNVNKTTRPPPMPKHTILGIIVMLTLFI